MFESAATQAGSGLGRSIQKCAGRGRGTPAHGDGSLHRSQRGSRGYRGGDPKENRWCGYAEAVAGHVAMRRGLQEACGSAPGGDWSKKSPALSIRDRVIILFKGRGSAALWVDLRHSAVWVSGTPPGPGGTFPLTRWPRLRRMVSRLLSSPEAIDWYEYVTPRAAETHGGSHFQLMGMATSLGTPPARQWYGPPRATAGVEYFWGLGTPPARQWYGPPRGGSCRKGICR